MKNRWILNLVLLAFIGALVAFLYMRPQTEEQSDTKYEVSQLKLAGINGVKVEFPAKAPVIFTKKDGYWHMDAPYKSRADQLSVQRILAVVAATSEYQFPTTDLAKYGLDNPLVKVTLQRDAGDAVFYYGTYNTVTNQQYVSHADGIYLLDVRYAEAAETQPIEMVDKQILGPSEVKQFAGFDYSHLEQWEAVGLNVDLVEGQWKTNLAKATLVQNDLNEWFEFSWKQNSATAVEVYTPDRQKTYPSFKLKLSNGKTIHFDKHMESPELRLARPDEGFIYHFPNDVGFNMLNPPMAQAESN